MPGALRPIAIVVGAFVLAAVLNRTIVVWAFNAAGADLPSKTIHMLIALAIWIALACLAFWLFKPAAKQSSEEKV
jgi:hypothetical protein